MRKKSFLMVDDEATFLETIQPLFVAAGEGKWEVFTAQTHAQALELLQKERVDLVVTDIGMPVMDGFQFARLLSRTHPAQHVVMLTGKATEEKRKACKDAGISMLLEKPTSAEGYKALFAALDSLADAHVQSGFRGMMRQVGLQEVLQMECLGRKSSLLEVFAGKVRGRIWICDGSIIHAETGLLQGETALYGLLALQGGEFNLQKFNEPPERTIEGQWEFLLMEAARLSDEGSVQALGEPQPGSGLPAPLEPGSAPASELPGGSASYQEQATTLPPDSIPEQFEASEPTAISSALGLPIVGKVRIDEVALCSGSGEVLYEWECRPLEKRLRLLQEVEQHASQVSTLLIAGRFDRLEIITTDGRVVCHVQPDRRLFLRSTYLPNDEPMAE